MNVIAAYLLSMLGDKTSSTAEDILGSEFLLGNWSGMDKERAKEYIINCQSYDGGFGLTPGAESHGGAIYCGITSLRLMGFLEEDVLSKNVSSSIVNVPLLLVWCLQRQAADGGFQGRPNKPSDTCYAFWIAGETGRMVWRKLWNWVLSETLKRKDWNY